MSWRLWPRDGRIWILRVELFGDEVDALAIINPLTGDTIEAKDELYIYPAKHFVTPDERIREAVEGINQELEDRLAVFRSEGKLLEAQRLSARTRFDMEMMMETGHCPGIENYARWFSGKKAGEPPYTLHDFLPPDCLVVVDESHATLPQVRAMFAGDHARKSTLVAHGFRLPSAARQSRPLRFDEWEKRMNKVLFMSATPADYELAASGGEVVEAGDSPDGAQSIQSCMFARPAARCLTLSSRSRSGRKRTSADFGDGAHQAARGRFDQLLPAKAVYGAASGSIRNSTPSNACRSAPRIRGEGLRCARQASIFCAEGLDLPEVSLVAILDADKEGFLRKVRGR